MRKFLLIIFLIFFSKSIFADSEIYNNMKNYGKDCKQSPTPECLMKVSLGLALPFIVGFLYGGWVGGLGCFLLAGVGRIFFVLNSTFCINSICHLWGKQPHGKENSSRDSWLVSLVTFGEGYHNYHHKYQSDYRNGSKWYNFDPSKWLIYSLSVMGMASSLRRFSDDLSI